MTDLSISIVTYNSAGVIAPTLSDLALSIPAGLVWQVYIVDNGSKDATLEQIESARPLFGERLTVLRSQHGNIGFGAAHNLVLPLVHSRFHLIMNPDILLGGPQALAALVRLLEDEPEVGLAVPQIQGLDGALQHLCRRDPTVLDLMLRILPGRLCPRRQDWHTMQDHDYQTPFEVPFASGSLMLIRTVLLREIGGFDPRFFLYAEDADLSRRARAQARVLYWPDAVVRHAWVRGSYHNPFLSWRHLQSLWVYFRKWGWRWS